MVYLTAISTSECHCILSLGTRLIKLARDMHTPTPDALCDCSCLCVDEVISVAAKPLLNPVVIGGPGHTVDIDECLLVRKKHNGLSFSPP